MKATETLMTKYPTDHEATHEVICAAHRARLARFAAMTPAEVIETLEAEEDDFVMEPYVDTVGIASRRLP